MYQFVIFIIKFLRILLKFIEIFYKISAKKKEAILLIKSPLFECVPTAVDKGSFFVEINEEISMDLMGIPNISTLQDPIK